MKKKPKKTKMDLILQGTLVPLRAPICYTKIVKSKKEYSRKNVKIEY